MNLDQKRLEIQRVRKLLAEEIEFLEQQGGCVRSFSSALLLAASELYSEVWSSDQLRAAFVQIAKAELLHSGNAGRA